MTAMKKTDKQWGHEQVSSGLIFDTTLMARVADAKKLRATTLEHLIGKFWRFVIRPAGTYIGHCMVEPVLEQRCRQMARHRLDMLGVHTLRDIGVRRGAEIVTKTALCTANDNKPGAVA